MNHTPTPWAVEYVYGGKATMVYARIYEVGHKSQSVGFAGIYKRTTKDEAIANAQFIVRACNAHEALVGALKLHLQFLDSLPSGWLGKTTGDVGLLNDAYIASSKSLKLALGE